MSLQGSNSGFVSMDRWKEIWSGKKLEGEPNLEDLLNLDGCGSGSGKIESDAWRQYVQDVSHKIGLEESDSVYEVGCGAGAFLYLIYGSGHKVGGIDYSSSLIDIAQKVMPGMYFSVGEARDVDTIEKYDVVVSNTVFQYFSDLGYAREVLTRMLDKAERVVAVLDVSDRALREEFEEARRGALPKGEYEKKYEGLDHLYYEKDWFRDAAKEHEYDIEIFGQDIQNYKGNRFRFNVVIKK